MKPNFALNLTHESIGLLHRSGRGWIEIGAAALDSPDLGEALTYLRRSALGLSPTGFATKLLIPNSQILYDRVHAPGPDEASRRAQIARALEGRTPYDVADLVFDWWGEGDEVDIAVVARETLDEAEQFARQYKFNPVSFAAIPEGAEFAGEPFFGPAAGATEAVERDAEPVRILQREVTPAPPPEAAPEDIPPAPVEAEPEPVAVEPAMIEAPESPVVEAPSVEAPPEEVPAEAPPVEAAAPADPATEPAPEPEPLPDPEGEAPVALDVEPLDDLPGDVSEAPAEPPALARGARVSLGPATADLPEASDDPAPDDPAPAFATRRQPEPMRASRAAPAAAPAPTSAPAKAPAKAPAPSAAKAAGKALSALVTAPGIPGLKPRKGAKPAKAAPKPAKAPAKAPAPPPPGATTAADPDSALAQFNRRPVRGKPRFLGLVLTGILLLLLALVAAWSSIYLASGRDTATPATETAQNAPAASPEDATVLDEAAADGQADLDALSLAEAEADGVPLDQAAPEAPAPETQTAAAQTAEAQASATPAPQAAPDTGALGPSQSGQDEIFLSAMDRPPEPLDPLALPAPDLATDAAPAAPQPPPPFGTLYAFDADGRILPTPEGVVTPDGVTLVSGRPALTPPARPQTDASAAALPPSDAPADPAASAEGVSAASLAATAPATAPDALTVFEADPALAGFRPQSRPEGLAPPPAEADATDPAAEDDASLAIPAESRFASLRPRSRPAAVVAAAEQARLAEEARKAAEAASLAAAATAAAEAAVAAEEEARANASALAVPVSRRPAARPKDLSRAVQAAAAAVRVRPPEPEPEPEPQQASAAIGRTPTPAPEPTIMKSPEADDEPELPASASRGSAPKGVVAKNATFVNAINLSKLNLIGVYGTQSNRYALVREANGRYRKVKVGDRLDGGRVAAITGNEVRYQKGGRMVSLAMPKG